VAEPPAPVQVSSYSVLLDRAPVDHAPLVVTAPCQPPAAVQCSALLAVQVSVELPEVLTVVGEAVSVTTGTGLTTPDPGCTAATPEVVACAVETPAAALVTLTAVEEVPTPPQAASAAIAVIPTPQRDRCETITLRVGTRSQWALTDACTFDVDVGATARLRPNRTMIASPLWALTLAVGRNLRTRSHDGRAIVIRFCKLANLSPNEHIADWRHTD